MSDLYLERLIEDLAAAEERLDELYKFRRNNNVPSLLNQSIGKRIATLTAQLNEMEKE